MTETQRTIKQRWTQTLTTRRNLMEEFETVENEWEQRTQMFPSHVCPPAVPFSAILFSTISSLSALQDAFMQLLKTGISPPGVILSLNLKIDRSGVQCMLGNVPLLLCRQWTSRTEQKFRAKRFTWIQLLNHHKIPQESSAQNQRFGIVRIKRLVFFLSLWVCKPFRVSQGRKANFNLFCVRSWEVQQGYHSISS